MNWNPEGLRGLPKVTQSQDQKPACLLIHILSTAFPSCRGQPNVVMISKMAITLHSFYEGVQPLIENLKTSTRENEINCKSSLQRKIGPNMHHPCCGYIAGPHSLLWGSTLYGKHRFVVGWARFHSYRALNLTPSHPPFPPCWVGSATPSSRGSRGKLWHCVQCQPWTNVGSFPLCFDRKHHQRCWKAVLQWQLPSFQRN